MGKRTDADRFWSKVIRDPDTDCWEWLGARVNGYGRFYTPERNAGLAHRWAYEHLVGPVPEGLQLDHLCRNRGCVNPEHLEPVTQWENVMRGRGLAAQNASLTHCRQGHELTPENVYIRAANPWRGCRICQREYDRRRRERRRAARKAKP